MPSDPSLAHENRLRANLEHVQQRIQDAAHRVDRSPDAVSLVAVTKYTQLDLVQLFHKLSNSPLGENRPQQLIERANQLPQDVNWHLIGQLQRNKVKAVLPYASLIHSVDTTRLLNSINRHAQELELRPRILLQVNVSGEETKSGFTPSQLISNWEEICQFRNIDVRGLMTMAPNTPDEKIIRESFRGLSQLKDQLNNDSEEERLTELSMGMSQDFEIAIEEGATLIRLGSVLFTGCEPTS
ncbi:YggS family pyridoxal phosphate-dependent enzyme [Thalassoglobus polymorphus]|uniref:Pyridoxal phosphate homeostasis protein n=1 Tax=Thalassoglobus polymorphus TaxID=2527994 RepID=A0A517QI44_9PLAN|nr:YggS family pyridoxal phosphate-dependent enzyme [Thalassoglobus polymorphus]QDT31264.1 Pyridoxal phosphate homeostasis protein [Thalassoglobus polymorphus]